MIYNLDFLVIKLDMGVEGEGSKNVWSSERGGMGDSWYY